MSTKLDLPIEQIIKEYQNGISTIELGKKYGCSDVTIANRLKEVDIKLRSCNEVHTLNLPMEQISGEYLSGMSSYKLGKKYGCHSSTIIDRLREADIKIRSLNEAQQNRFEDPKEIEKNRNSQLKYWEDNQEDREKMSVTMKKYYENNPEVGKKHGEKLKKYYEDNPEAGKKHGEKLKKYYDDNPKAREKASEAMKKYHEDNPEAAKEHGKVIKKVMEDPKVKQNLSKGQKKRFEDSKEREKSRNGTIKYFEDHPEAREEASKKSTKYWSDQESRIKMSCIILGIKREEWDGFKNTYCDQWTEELREHIRDKYGRKCFICGLPESENKFKNGKQVKLSVHHVDYNKQCGCDGTECRLVPLCIEHHSHTTSGDREMWEELIMDMIDNLIEN